MEPINDDAIVRMIKQIVDHYHANISNRFIRPALLQLSVDDILWGQIESLTERYNQYQGYQLHDLYRQIGALCKFVYAARQELAPTLKYKIGNSYADKMDKLFLDMAINNFSANLQVLADQIYELYKRLVEIDTAASKGKRPLYRQYSELNDIEEVLMVNKEIRN